MRFIRVHGRVVPVRDNKGAGVGTYAAVGAASGTALAAMTKVKNPKLGFALGAAAVGGYFGAATKIMGNKHSPNQKAKESLGLVAGLAIGHKATKLATMSKFQKVAQAQQFGKLKDAVKAGFKKSVRQAHMKQAIKKVEGQVIHVDFQKARPFKSWR